VRPSVKRGAGTDKPMSAGPGPSILHEGGEVARAG
jgi:hypothetical protein